MKKRKLEIAFFVVSSLFIFHPILIKVFFVIFNFVSKKKNEDRGMQAAFWSQLAREL